MSLPLRESVVVEARRQFDVSRLFKPHKLRGSNRTPVGSNASDRLPVGNVRYGRAWGCPTRGTQLHPGPVTMWKQVLTIAGARVERELGSVPRPRGCVARGLHHAWTAAPLRWPLNAVGSAAPRSRRGRKSFGRLDIRRRLRPSASSWSGQRCWPPGWRAMNLDLDLAADFLVLVEERHYGRAAARLYLTPPALTKRMQRLERLLGVVILERGPAGVLRLTAAGERFAREAAPLLAHAAWVRDVVRHPPGRYTVRVGYPAGTGVFPGRIPLAAIFRDIRREHPEASFACTKVPFTALTDCLPTHAVDVLWTSAAVQHEGVESVPAMADSALIGVVSSRHELAEAGV